MSPSKASGINAAGQVVGNYNLVGNTGTTHAFLYDTVHGMIDLNSLINPSSGWVLNVAQSINDFGQITGTGTIGGQQHAFVLTLVPEPARQSLHTSWRGHRQLVRIRLATTESRLAGLQVSAQFFFDGSTARRISLLDAECRPRHR